MTIHHIVLIRTQSDSSARIVSQEIAELCDRTTGLEYQYFSAAQTVGDTPWDIMFDMRFPTLGEVDRFLTSEEHMRVSKQLSSHIKELLSFDMTSESTQEQ